MFNSGEGCSDAAVALLLRRRDGFRDSAFPLNMDAPPSFVQSCFALSARITAIGIHVSPGVAATLQVFKDGGIGDSSNRDDDPTNHFVALAYARMQLVAETVLAMLRGPFRIDIFLRALGRFSRDRHDILFDDFRLLALVPLFRCLHQGGVDYLAATCQITMSEELLHLPKQLGA